MRSRRMRSAAWMSRAEGSGPRSVTAGARKALTTRSAAACVARSEKLGAAPTPAPTEEARWLLQRLAASESRRQKAEFFF